MDKWEILDHTFKFRVGDSEEAGGCTLIGGEWKDVTTNDLFKNKKVVLFSLPGAFTPTCSGQELPSYDNMHQQFKDKDEKEVEDNAGVLHKGIAKRMFTKSFTIAEDVEIKGAELKDGLLVVSMEKVIPEHKKARTIQIK